MPNFNASVENIDRTLHVLCREIGNRVGASAAELRAAEFVADEMRALGLQNVTLSASLSTCGVTGRAGAGAGRARPGAGGDPVANSRRPRRRPGDQVVYVDHGTPADLACTRSREDRAGVGPSHGAMPTLRALGDCGCVGVLWWMTASPTDWPVAIGTPFDWRRLLDKPQLGIAWDGLRLAREPGRGCVFSDAWSGRGR